LAINPQFSDYLNGQSDDNDQWRGGGRDNTPPMPPVDAKEGSMPPPGMKASTPAPDAPMPAPRPGMAPTQAGPPVAPQGAPPPPSADPQQDQDIANMQAIPPEPGSDVDPQDKQGTDYTGKRQKLLQQIETQSTPTEYKSNWAQRLGMALLASTKLAPIANMIVHPKWTEQEHNRQAQLAASEGQLKDIDTAESAEALSEQRRASAEQRLRDKAKENYITVPGGGLFNTKDKTWEREPVDKSQLTQISPDEGEANGIKPIEDGTYWIPNAAVGSLITSHKEKIPTPSVHVLPDGKVISVTGDEAKVVYQGDPKVPTEVKQLQIGNKPHQVLINAQTGETIKDLGETGEKPPVINVNSEQRKDRAAGVKAYEPALESAERFNVMTKNYEDAVKNNDQQAMLSLLANHLGMTMGLQKGARLNKDIIQEAIHSRPWLQGIGSKFDKDGYLSGVTLTQPQMQQMVNLGRERFAEDISKAKNIGDYQGITEGPNRTPNKSTMNHYLGMTGGDVAKAKAMAAADGWTVR
jgi:hypothetical protein